VGLSIIKLDFLTYVMPQGSRAIYEGEDFAELTHHMYGSIVTHTINLDTR